MSTWCILLSGGNGLRMGTQSNKTLISLLGEPALCRALRTLRRHADGIILVIRPQDEDETRTALNDAQLTVDGVAYGGADRQESVRNGLSLLPEDCDIVLVHDGARPLVDDQTIENVLSSVRKYGSGVAATPVTDTIKRVGADDIVADTPPRGQLRAVQTPQGFSRDLLCRAHAEITERCTDDAALVEQLGVPVPQCPGSPRNRLHHAGGLTQQESSASGIPLPTQGNGHRRAFGEVLQSDAHRHGHSPHQSRTAVAAVLQRAESNAHRQSLRDVVKGDGQYQHDDSVQPLIRRAPGIIRVSLGKGDDFVRTPHENGPQQKACRGDKPGRGPR